MPNFEHFRGDESSSVELLISLSLDKRLQAQIDCQTSVMHLASMYPILILERVLVSKRQSLAACYHSAA